FLTIICSLGTLITDRRKDMPPLNWNQRFFESTRGRIIMLLRRANRTVEELAQALDLTDNAVRAHLATLERDGFVRQRGARRGSGKPAFVYELTPETEQLFPKAYGLVLRELLHLLNEHMPADEVEALLRLVCGRLGAWGTRAACGIALESGARRVVRSEVGGLCV